MAAVRRPALILSSSQSVHPRPSTSRFLTFTVTTTFILTLALFLLTASPVLAASTPKLQSHQPTKRSATPSEASAPGSCGVGFEGDQDTYGLGIRIGLYLQWITSSIAYNFVPAEAVTMRGVNNSFQLAMFAGLLFVTVTKGSDLYAVEGYLILLFCMGGVCSGGSLSTQEQNTRGDGGSSGVGGGTSQSASARSSAPFAYFESTTAGGLVRLAIGCAFVAYGLWFVFVGMDGMKAPECARSAFFFARVDLFGWFRSLLKALFVLSAVPAFLSLIVSVLGLGKLAYKSKKKRGGRAGMRAGTRTGMGSGSGNGSGNGIAMRQQGQQNHGSQSPPEPTPQTLWPPMQVPSTAHPSPPPPPPPPATLPTRPTDRTITPPNPPLRQTNNTIVLGKFAGGALIMFIVAVELTLRWNDVKGVHDVGSTGQLLPLIIGISGLGRVGYALVKRAGAGLSQLRNAKERRVDEEDKSEDEG